jgi:hypothetical protein
MVFRLQELYSISSAKKGVAYYLPLRLLTVTAWSRILLQKLIVHKLAKKSPPPYIEAEGSLLFSQKPATCLYPQHPNQFLRYNVILSHIRRDILIHRRPIFFKTKGHTFDCGLVRGPHVEKKQ